MTVSCKTKHVVTIQPTDDTRWHLSHRNENLCSHKNLYMNVYNSFTFNAETRINPDFLQWGNYQTNYGSYIIYHGILLSNKNEQTTDMCNNLDEPLGNYTK